MESTLVIKVRYADTLRRFNAVIKEDGQLALNLEGLRAKVHSLFSVPSGAVIGLTYVDEDGDVVTLVDDSDLQDVTRQNLKFLKVNVNLKTEKAAFSYAASSGSSTPLRSPATQKPSPANVGSTVADMLKTLQPALSALPPTVADAVSKISSDLASKAAASGAQFKLDGKEVSKSVQQPLYEALSKISLDLASSAPVLTDLVDSLSKIGLSYISTPQEPQTAVANASPQTKEAGAPTAPSVAPGASSDGGMQVDLADYSVSTHVVPGPSNPVSSAHVDLNLDPPSCSSPLVENLSQNKAAEKETKILSAGVHGPTDTVNPGGSSCPFSGAELFKNSYSYTLPPPLPTHFKPYKPFKRSHSRSDGMVGLFHRGVQCDGCGVHPIAGPRYKSIVKENYDLCCVCFAQMGNESEYVKMDKPMAYRHSRSFRGSNCPALAGMVPTVRPLTKPGGSVQPRLDSRFISDVNVVDGTVLAPSTPFKKIWRLHNNGNLVWPIGTRLVWIGGDRFSHTDSSELEISANGLPVDAELDVAISFTSPELPGRYISYWRMVSPSGTKFGQRIWVLIHVDASLKVAAGTSLQGLNLNLPPPVSVTATESPQIVVDATGKPSGSFLPSETMMMPMFDAKSEQEKNFPVNDALLLGNRPSAPLANSSSSYLPYAMIDLSDSAAGPSSTINNPGAPAAIGTNKPTVEQEGKKVDDAVEESLLKELEEMGFKQVDLNKEILRMNEYDLDQSLDDLCGVGEWDPILEELKEMGFCDDEMNKKLLKKNNGSIKRVVMDLLTGEKA